MSETRADRLRKARKAANFKSASEAARSLGVSPSTYIHHENGTRDYDEAAAALYARRYHVTVSWLLLGQGEMETSELAAEREKELEQQRQEEEEYRAARAEMDPDTKERLAESHQRSQERSALQTLRTMALIPEISPYFAKDDTLLARGWRRFTDFQETVVHSINATWGIPPKHLQYELGASQKSIVFPIVGDANAPTLLHGDMVFVDTAMDDLIADGLYLVADKVGSPQVRRLRANLFAQSPSVVVSSDATPEASQVVEMSSISIIGKVVARLTRM